MELNEFQRKKLNKTLIISASILFSILLILIGIVLVINSNKQEAEIDYTDIVRPKNYFTSIVIDLETKKVSRDGIDTSLTKEFEIDEGRANLILSSMEELDKFFMDSTMDIKHDGNKVELKDMYQTKNLLVRGNDIKDTFNAENKELLGQSIYLLKYDTEKRCKVAYEYLSKKEEIESIEIDEVWSIKPINDESQTLYGSSKDDDEDGNVYGTSGMGFDNYKNVINENGNPAEIVVSTIGYGASINNKYFENRIDENYFNYIKNSKDIYETNAQGSRILEVIKESTTNNVKLQPLVVVNEDNNTTKSAILRAIFFAKNNSDVICYELVHDQSNFIDIALKNAFQENVPVCCVTKSKSNEDEKIYPANNATTIAVSSVNKELKTTSYSAVGDYLDFVASSTDVKEIFNGSSAVSKWSGPQYSNAEIASAIALIKTYSKNATILDIYNVLRNYAEDLGMKGKDSTYGYGFVNFSKIRISDIDKENPANQQIIFDDNEWTKTKSVELKATDNIKIYGWNVTKTEDVPKEWNKMEQNVSSIDVTYELKEKGKYYAWVTDSAGNVIYGSFEIAKIDNEGPKINYEIDNSRQVTENLLQIKVTAEDEGAGLHDSPFSWDNQNWGKENTTLTVTENGEYKIYAKDKLDNISEKTIKIDSFPKKGTAQIDTGDIIKSIDVSSDWEDDLNKKVVITTNDNISIKKWKISTIDQMPEEIRQELVIFNQRENQQINNTTTNTTTQNTTTQNITWDADNSNNTINTTSGNTVINNTTTNVVTNTITNNTIANNTTNSTTVILPATNQDIQAYSNITITVSLKANQKYYIWIIDTEGNVKSQGFIISKQK